MRSNRLAFKQQKISAQNYTEFNQQKIKECIQIQEEIGLDVLVHGEFERNDMVEYFGENLQGFLFTQNGWVQSYGTRCVKPPVIWAMYHALSLSRFLGPNLPKALAKKS